MDCGRGRTRRRRGGRCRYVVGAAEAQEAAACCASSAEGGRLNREGAAVAPPLIFLRCRVGRLGTGREFVEEAAGSSLEFLATGGARKYGRGGGAEGEPAESGQAGLLLRIVCHDGRLLRQVEPAGAASVPSLSRGRDERLRGGYEGQ